MSTNEIMIAVNYENDNPTISGRELHAALMIDTRYNDWFKRMCEYGFIEGKDFYSFLSKTSEGGRPSTDHQLTIDMAKEICMIQRSEIGKKCREYFIAIEKKWNNPEAIMARALQIAKKEIKELEAKIEEDKPMVEFAEQITNKKGFIDIGTFAKLIYNEDLKIGRNRLLAYLRKKKILNDRNCPYQKYVNNGYFTYTSGVIEPYSIPYCKPLISGKGQKFVLEMLRNDFGQT